MKPREASSMRRAERASLRNSKGHAPLSTGEPDSAQVGVRRPGNVANVLCKTDVAARTTVVQDFGGVGVVGEPLVVADPASDAAVLLVVTHDPSGAAHLVVVDAASMEEVARGTLPAALPYGFHGTWIPA